jgi:hypothetical protein
MEIELQEKRQRIGRTRRALRSIRDFVDRHLTAKTVVVVTILLLVASWIYPPWIYGYSRGKASHGWFFVFDTTREFAMSIDFGRLLLIDGILAAAGGLLAWAAFHSSKTFRKAIHITVYSLLAMPLIATLCLGAFLVQRQVAKKHAFDPRDLGAIPVQAETQPKAPWSEYDALLTVVPPDDLKKISLFDVGPDIIGYNFCAGFHGRVRNDLPRAVEKIGLKASFYNAAGQLIEVRTFWLTHGQGAGQSGIVSPNSPVSFEDLRNARVDHLPQGWKYQLEVIEADYVK